MTTTAILDDQELNTILAALRFWQEQGLADDPEKRGDALHDIATNCGNQISMNAEGIDDLCERINFEDPALAAPTPLDTVKIFAVVSDKRYRDAYTIYPEPAPANAGDQRQEIDYGDPGAYLTLVGFSTLAQAQAFKEGVQWVNDDSHQSMVARVDDTLSVVLIDTTETGDSEVIRDDHRNLPEPPAEAAAA